MCGNDNACGAAYLGEFLHAHSVCKRIAALAAVLFGNGNAKEAGLRHLLNGSSGENLCLVHFLGQGLNFFFCELFEKSSRHFMLFA
jgi:hypothetical protein